MYVGIYISKYKKKTLKQNFKRMFQLHIDTTNILKNQY